MVLTKIIKSLYLSQDFFFIASMSGAILAILNFYSIPLIAPTTFLIGLYIMNWTADKMALGSNINGGKMLLLYPPIQVGITFSLEVIISFMMLINKEPLISLVDTVEVLLRGLFIFLFHGS